MGLRKKLVAAAILYAAIPSVSFASGNTLTAITCSQTDVQTALTNAQDGDTVAIPAGTCTWTSGISNDADARRSPSKVPVPSRPWMVGRARPDRTGP